MFKRNNVKYFTLVALTVATTGISSCGLSQGDIVGRVAQAAINSTIGYLSPVSVQQELQIGQQMLNQVAAEFKAYNASPELVNYVKAVGAKIVTQAQRKNELNYQFYVLDNQQVNAFTIPGGAVFITTEALKYLNNEAELAGVLAHEVGHNDRKHPVESIKRALAAQGIASGAFKSTDSGLVKIIADLTLGLILKGFDRNQEKDADEAGTKMAANLSYDPLALSGFLKTLSDLSGGRDPSGIVQILQTHPGSLDRISNINDFISKNGINVTSPVINEEGYKKIMSVLPAKVNLKR